MIGALDQPSVNMDEKETSTTSPLKEQDQSQSAPRHNPLLDSSRYQEPSDLKKAITDQLTSELVLMKKESDALKQIKDRTEEKIDLFDETDEDENIPLENIFQKVKVIFYSRLSTTLPTYRFPYQRNVIHYLTFLEAIK